MHTPTHPGTHTHVRSLARTHTHTHRQICNIYCSSTAPIFTRTLLNVTLYVHCLSCEILITRVNYRSCKSLQHKGLLYLSIVYTMNTEWRGLCEMCHPYSYWQHKILVVRIFYDINCNRGERSKARVYDRSLAGIAGSNPAGDMDVCLLWVLCVFR